MSTWRRDVSASEETCSTNQERVTDARRTVNETNYSFHSLKKGFNTFVIVFRSQQTSFDRFNTLSKRRQQTTVTAITVNMRLMDFIGSKTSNVAAKDKGKRKRIY